ncbi:MAG: hypothetical protein WA090_01615 [Candidatus Nanopelagicaceae bacterium]
MPEDPYEHDVDSNIIRGLEIYEENESKFREVARELIDKDSVSFVFLGKRIILTTYGLSYNMGFNLETEDLDGTQRFKSGWCYYPDNYEDRVQAITTAVSILAAEIESAAPIK